MVFSAQKFWILTISILLFFFYSVHGQYLENFDEVPPQTEWRTVNGDGHVISSLKWNEGTGSIIVNATSDQWNIWWAIMQTTITDALDLEQLAQPGYELRVETRIRSSHAPRRVNLHINTQRTVDFHTHLIEFDIPDTTNWHTISMTTQNFDGKPGDTINAHLALMDWGTGTYRVDVDYFKVNVVNPIVSDIDLGEHVLYPPPMLQPDDFEFSSPVAEAGMIDMKYPDINFNGWVAGTDTVLTADGSKMILLRWNLDEYAECTVSDYGMLQLSLHSFYRANDIQLPEFNNLRLVEILGGNPHWDREEVTMNNFTNGQPVKTVLNPQMIVDVKIQGNSAPTFYIHIPRPVIQRLLEGRTLGISLYPLGPMSASFYPGSNRDDPIRPRLFFNIDC